MIPRLWSCYLKSRFQWEDVGWIQCRKYNRSIFFFFLLIPSYISLVYGKPSFCGPADIFFLRDNWTATVLRNIKYFLPKRGIKYSSYSETHQEIWGWSPPSTSIAACRCFRRLLYTETHMSCSLDAHMLLFATRNLGWTAGSSFLPSGMWLEMDCVQVEEVFESRCQTLYILGKLDCSFLINLLTIV